MIALQLTAKGLTAATKALEGMIDTKRMAAEINRLTIKGRNELNRRLSVPARRDPFWGPVAPGGAVLGVRSGDTRAKLGPGTVRVRGNEIIGRVGHPSRHVKHLEKGGVVRGNMQIPTAAALTPAGRPSVRAMGPTFIIRSRRGNRWRATSERGQLVLLKLLKSSVRHEPHPVFQETWRKLRPDVVAAVKNGIKITGGVVR